MNITGYCWPLLSWSSLVMASRRSWVRIPSAPPVFQRKAFSVIALALLVAQAVSGQTPAQSAGTAQPPNALRCNPIAYLGSKIRVWTRDDAEDELGRPAQREDAVDIQTNDHIGDTFKFKTTVAQFSEVDLTFDHNSRKLAVAYLYPKAALTSATLRDALGKDFVKFVNPNGMPSYVYQQSQRTISIQADVQDDVVNVMIW